MRKATGLDWAGDPIEVKGRFKPRHGEDTYEQMVEHFKDYNDIIGDHPQNMGATSLALNAYMLEHEPKYKEWLLEYVDAWRERTIRNDGIIPTNIGLDGKIGGATDGKWYGGVYGWGFSVRDPASGQLAHRNTHGLGITGFGNALLLTGDQKYVDVWRDMIDKINEQVKTINGQKTYPRMYGDNGWYNYAPSKYSQGAREIYYWSMKSEDRRRLGNDGWLNFLDGNDPDYPVRVLQYDFAAIRNKVQGMRDDETTPDTRLSDDPMPFNPCSVNSLISLMLGGIHPGHRGAPLHCRLRYFRSGSTSRRRSRIGGSTGGRTFRRSHDRHTRQHQPIPATRRDRARGRVRGTHHQFDRRRRQGDQSRRFLVYAAVGSRIRRTDCPRHDALCESTNPAVSLGSRGRLNNRIPAIPPPSVTPGIRR